MLNQWLEIEDHERLYMHRVVCDYDSLRNKAVEESQILDYGGIALT